MIVRDTGYQYQILFHINFGCIVIVYMAKIENIFHEILMHIKEF